MRYSSQQFKEIFNQAIADFHLHDDVDYPMSCPYVTSSFEELLYKKCWIDTIQWHLEDEIRHPQIDPNTALNLKRRIDQLNQRRTDLVEAIDTFFLEAFKGVTPVSQATINTESPAWAIDRLSILQLKLYHMCQETVRIDTTTENRMRCQQKFAILQEQDQDLSQSIDELLVAIASGQKIMKVYRQMKMYNDPQLNPVLYKHSS